MSRGFLRAEAENRGSRQLATMQPSGSMDADVYVIEGPLHLLIPNVPALAPISLALLSIAIGGSLTILAERRKSAR